MTTATKFTTPALKTLIADYVKNNPGCVTNQYDAADVVANSLKDFEVKLQNPKAWKRMEKSKEGNRIFRFFIVDQMILDQHNFYDEDSVKVYIYTDSTDTKIVKFSLECE